jgi:hypothetical protein
MENLRSLAHQFSFISATFSIFLAIFDNWSFRPCYSLYLNPCYLNSRLCRFSPHLCGDKTSLAFFLALQHLFLLFIYVQPSLLSFFVHLCGLNQINQLLVLSSLLDLNNQDQHFMCLLPTISSSSIASIAVPSCQLQNFDRAHKFLS